MAFLAVTSAYAQNPLITTWKTDNPGASSVTSITIPTTGGGYNYEVDWNNDGIYDQSGITGNVTHDFGVAGTYTIRISGTFPRIFFQFAGDARKLLDVQQWGDIAWTSMNSAFGGCSNLNISATDLPNLSGVTDMGGMFRGYSVNGPANIGNWNTANVTRTDFMFEDAIAFNQSLGNWNTANMTNMSGMFLRASAFNQPIDNWNTANMTDMSGMFFSASAFNQPLGNWNTANVTNMNSMFSGASAFNQPIGNWSTANVTSMSNMFSGASAFNQPIGTWTLKAGVNLSSMLNGSGLDCDNYSATLIGWSANPLTPNSLTLGASGRQYGTNAVAARTKLDINKAWTISGDAPSGVACPAPLPIELIGFTALSRENSILLTWQTASEQNNAGFYVERSADALRWADLGFVAGKGSTDEKQHYAFTDENPLSRLSYYRLRQVDLDGGATFSRVVSIHRPAVGGLRIFPNPASAKTELSFDLPTSAAVHFEVYDLLGRLQLLSPEETLPAGANQQQLDFSQLPAGVYMLQLHSAGALLSRQLVIER